MNWKKMTLKMKLITGFSIVLLLLIVVSGVGFFTINGASGGFTEYRKMARDSILVGQLQAHMLEVRMSVKNFLISGSEQDLKDHQEHWAQVLKFNAQSRKEIRNPKQADMVSAIEQRLAEYEKGFEEIVRYSAERDRMVSKILNINGSSMEKALTEIMMSANDDGDVTAAFHAGMTMRNLLLARLYLVKFLNTNDWATVDRVHQEFESLAKNIEFLDTNIEDPHRRELLSQFKAYEKIYLKTFDELVTVTFNRNGRVSGTLDRIGPEVADTVEKLKLGIKEVQDEIGPRLQASDERAVVIILSVSLIALLVGGGIVVLITRSVMSQLGSDPGDIAEIADQIAKGNLAIRFKNDSGDRGVYASMRHMAKNLSGMIRDIAGGVLTLDSSSSELSAVSEQMASNVEETAMRSNSVAAASEEMSTNMNSVAASMEQTTANVQTIVSAVEEMSATINKIANNTAKGSRTTAQAVTTAREVSSKVGDLGKAASEISKVTETIADISEQTNLLALNATIEAARAGEAGKGFTVVAGEIKALAQQTAEATSEISSRIAGVQATTRESVGAIESIVNIIIEINDIVTTVATAIEEQSATTREISNNVGQIAFGVNEVNENVNQVSAVVMEVNTDISQVSQSTDEVKAGGAQVRVSAAKLSDLAGTLKQMVAQFTV